MGTGMPGPRSGCWPVSIDCLQHACATQSRLHFRHEGYVSWKASGAYDSYAGTWYQVHGADSYTDRHGHPFLPCTGFEIQGQCQSPKRAMLCALYGMGGRIHASLGACYLAYGERAMDAPLSVSTSQIGANFREV